jgi:hypothetical protein
MQQIFQFIILTFVYSSACFGRFSSHHQELNDCSGSLWFCLRIVVIVVLCSWSGRPAGAYSISYMSDRYCYLLASGNEMELSRNSISFPLAST